MFAPAHLRKQEFIYCMYTDSLVMCRVSCARWWFICMFTTVALRYNTPFWKQKVNKPFCHFLETTPSFYCCGFIKRFDGWNTWSLFSCLLNFLIVGKLRINLYMIWCELCRKASQTDTPPEAWHYPVQISTSSRHIIRYTVLIPCWILS